MEQQPQPTWENITLEFSKPQLQRLLADVSRSNNDEFQKIILPKIKEIEQRRQVCQKDLEIVDPSAIEKDAAATLEDERWLEKNNPYDEERTVSDYVDDSVKIFGAIHRICVDAKTTIGEYARSIKCLQIILSCWTQLEEIRDDVNSDALDSDMVVNRLFPSVDGKKKLKSFPELIAYQIASVLNAAANDDAFSKSDLQDLITSSLKEDKKRLISSFFAEFSNSKLNAAAVHVLVEKFKWKPSIAIFEEISRSSPDKKVIDDILEFSGKFQRGALDDFDELLKSKILYKLNREREGFASMTKAVNSELTNNCRANPKFYYDIVNLMEISLNSALSKSPVDLKNSSSQEAQTIIKIAHYISLGLNSGAMTMEKFLTEKVQQTGVKIPMSPNKIEIEKFSEAFTDRIYETLKRKSGDLSLKTLKKFMGMMGLRNDDDDEDDDHYYDDDDDIYSEGEQEREEEEEEDDEDPNRPPKKDYSKSYSIMLEFSEKFKLKIKNLAGAQDLSKLIDTSRDVAIQQFFVQTRYIYVVDALCTCFDDDQNLFWEHKNNVELMNLELRGWLARHPPAVKAVQGGSSNSNRGKNKSRGRGRK
eukprot:TRINITY_DN2655_c2_g2_i1.p1 TRINITY_DN2655_c2_g2~~TRINITY_DN2655_c2_g2_i1.p1  ORF type:complete len:590 (-),score=237.98 TRINITY_DN2655_c2_g2_i1:39-1808(-)